MTLDGLMAIRCLLDEHDRCTNGNVRGMPFKELMDPVTNIELGARELAHWRDGGGVMTKTIVKLDSQGHRQKVTKEVACDHKTHAWWAHYNHGPRYIAKPGPVMLARKSGCPIVVFHVGVDRGKTFTNTWDHFLMPAILSRRITFLAKQEYFTGPGIKGALIAAFFRSAGQIPVDRTGGKAAAVHDRRAAWREARGGLGVGDAR